MGVYHKNTASANISLTIYFSVPILPKFYQHNLLVPICNMEYEYSTMVTMSMRGKVQRRYTQLTDLLIHTCMHTYTYTHVCTHTHTHMYAHIHIHTCMHTYTYTHVCTHTHTHMYAHIMHSNINYTSSILTFMYGTCFHVLRMMAKYCMHLMVCLVFLVRSLPEKVFALLYMVASFFVTRVMLMNLLIMVHVVKKNYLK